MSSRPDPRSFGTAWSTPRRTNVDRISSMMVAWSSSSSRMLSCQSTYGPQVNLGMIRPGKAKSVASRGNGARLEIPKFGLLYTLECLNSLSNGSTL